MSTFQAIIYGILDAFSTFLPISQKAHRFLLSYFTGWSEPVGIYSFAMTLSVLLALLVYFRHDFASFLGSILRVLFTFKFSKTLDERMPFFILLSFLPVYGLWFYLQAIGKSFPLDPLWIAGSLIFFSLPLHLAHSMNRKLKNLFNWNWLDAIIVGITQILVFIPGAGRQLGALTGALFRNYTKEAAIKFVFYSLLPIVLARLYLDYSDMVSLGQNFSNSNKVTLFTSGFVTLFAGLLAIGGFVKSVQIKGIRGYLGYRVLLGISILIVFWVRS